MAMIVSALVLTQIFPHRFVLFGTQFSLVWIAIPICFAVAFTFFMVPGINQQKLVAHNSVMRLVARIGLLFIALSFIATGFLLFSIQTLFAYFESGPIPLPAIRILAGSALVFFIGLAAFVWLSHWTNSNAEFE